MNENMPVLNTHKLTHAVFQHWPPFSRPIRDHKIGTTFKNWGQTTTALWHTVTMTQQLAACLFCLFVPFLRQYRCVSHNISPICFILNILLYHNNILCFLFLLSLLAKKYHTLNNMSNSIMLLYFHRDINKWTDKMQKIHLSQLQIRELNGKHFLLSVFNIHHRRHDRSIISTYAGEIINHCRPETLSAFIQFPDQSFVLLQTANRCLFNTLGMIMTWLGKKGKEILLQGANTNYPTSLHLSGPLFSFNVPETCQWSSSAEPPVPDYVKPNNGA